MDIDTNKSSGEEEYRPSDYDSSVFEATPTTTTTSTGGSTTSSVGGTNKAANLMEHLNRKNILIAVGVIVGIFCIYKIVDVLFAPGVPRHKTTTTAVQAQMPKTIQQSNAQQSMNNITNRGQESIAAASVVNRLNTLEQQTVNEQNNLQQLSTQINDLQTALSNLDSKISTITSSLQTVSEVVARQQTDLAAKQAARKKAAQAAHAAPRPIYYAKAMVPGRAWLMTENGDSITVSLGNNLPGYGTVEVIDPNQGTLITSTGAIIGYSPGDS